MFMNIMILKKKYEFNVFMILTLDTTYGTQYIRRIFFGKNCESSLEG